MSDLAVQTDTLTNLSSGMLHSLITTAGERASYKFVEFFTAHISSDNTRRAYARAAYRFLAWCEDRGLELSAIHPVAVAGYTRQLEQELSPASVKVHLAAIRMLFDWFVVEGVVSYNPAASVKGPKHSPKRGKTPVLTAVDTRRLFESIQLESIKDYRDRAILGVLFYAWVRVSAACKLDVGDYYHVGKNSFLRFKEKGGKVHAVPAHHKAVEYLDTYLQEANIDPLDKQQKKLPLFRTLNRSRTLSEQRLDRHNLYWMLKQRALAAGITADVSVHSARATGITTYLENGGQLEAAQDMAEPGILEVLAGDGAFSMLLTALETSNLTAVLSGPGPFTVLAPTNHAFERLPQSERNALLGDPEALAAVLANHIIPGLVTSTDAAGLDYLTTLTGETLGFAEDGSSVGEAKLIASDMATSNGVIHIVDALLLPEAPNTAPVVANTLADVLLSSPDFSTFVSLLEMTGMLGTLRDIGPVTVLAPTNAALEQLSETTLDNLTADPVALTAYLRDYLLAGAARQSDLEGLSAVTTLAEHELTVTVTPEGTRVGGALITIGDIEPSNGILHIIDSPLAPPLSPSP